MSDLEGKIVLITGGASGIGEAVVAAATAAGARVAVADINGEAALRVAGGHAGARGYQVDTSDAQAVERLCAQVVSDFGRLDGAVNSAGISGELVELHQSSIENWHRVIDINLSGVYFSMRAQIPHMLANGFYGRCGRRDTTCGLYRLQARRCRPDQGGGARIRSAGHSLQRSLPQLRQDTDDAQGHSA